MGIFDFLKKDKKSTDDQSDTPIVEVEDEKKSKPGLSSMMKGVDTAGMSTKEKLAFKMFQRMSPQKQQEIMRKAMNPQAIQKNKDKILKQIDDMVKNGQIDKGQAEAVKSQMGLR